MAVTGLKRRIEKLEAYSAESAAIERGEQWKPNPGPQLLAYNSLADELFYGGAAGGGKTDLLLGLAGSQHRNSIIFRRVFPSLRAVIERSRVIYQAIKTARVRDRYNESMHLWRLANGRLVEFGALQHESDRLKYQGQPHDLYAFDELPEFREGQYTYVTAWNRTTIPGQRCRIVNSGNPPTTIEGEWVIRRWAPWLDDQFPKDQRAKPGELRWFVPIDGKDTEVESDKVIHWKGYDLRPRSRTFIPARLTDNPQLMVTDYASTLFGLPEPLRSKLLTGDFSIKLGSDPFQVIPTEWIRAAQRRWLSSARQTKLSALGIDVARGGSDNTVFTPRYENYFDEQIVFAGHDTPNGIVVARDVVSHLGLNPNHLNAGVVWANQTPLQIDIIGVGASVYDILKMNGFNVKAVDFRRRTGATDRSGKLRFANLRAEAYWKLREDLDPDYGKDLSLPPGDELLIDLAAPRWSVTQRGILVEPKEDIQERIGRSPDWGDSLVIANLDNLPGERDNEDVTTYGYQSY